MMKKKLALAMATVAVLGACGKQAGTSEAAGTLENKSSDEFNLARYLRENPSTSGMSDFIGSGDAYIFFGETKKFRIETNLNLSVTGKEGWFFGTRSMDARYWLDGYVFNKKLGSGKGFILDAGAYAGLKQDGAEVYIRFLGDDKYRQKASTVVDKAFTRDLSINAVFYPVPLLGVKASGNIGGELGSKMGLSMRQDDALSLVFRPRANISAGIAAGIQALLFLTAEAQGNVKVAEVEIATSSNLGYLPDVDFVYGDVGMDAGEIRALDGEVALVAKAEVSGLLPAGVDRLLWDLLVGDRQWKHVIWDPKPLYISGIPGYGSSFMRFERSPSAKDCTYAADKLEIYAGHMGNYAESVDGLEARVANVSRQHLQEILSSVRNSCGQEAESYR